MNEKPILFSTEMVQAILEGRKTQTRRVVKPLVDRQTDGAWLDAHDPDEDSPGQWVFTESNLPLGPFKCPYGTAGDRLWVRETWGTDIEYGATKPSDLPHIANIYYRTDGEGQPGLDQWRPSIFMPRWASRLNLQIIKVGVERLQAITEAGALAEGVTPGGLWNPAGADVSMTGGVGYKPRPTARDSFSYLWDAINARRSYTWANDPWVWVVTFEVER